MLTSNTLAPKDSNSWQACLLNHSQTAANQQSGNRPTWFLNPVKLAVTYWPVSLSYGKNTAGNKNGCGSITSNKNLCHHPKTKWINTTIFLREMGNTHLHGQRAKTPFQGETSKSWVIHSRRPKDSVISQVFFNEYNLQTTPYYISTASYADYASGPKMWPTNHLYKYLVHLSATLLNKMLNAKSTVTLFMPHTQDANLHLKIKIVNNILLVEQNPKILVVTFGSPLKFAAHACTEAKV